MKKNLFQRLSAGLTAGLLLLACTGCSTSAMENANSYFGNVSKIVNNLTSGSQTDTAVAEETASSNAEPLAAVTEFTMDEAGNYSFKGVSDADFYLIYFCEPEAVDDEADYIYASSPIEENGAEVYTGNCSDLFHYAYGEYLVKVFAFPELTDSTRVHSSGVSAEYTYSGEQAEPVIDYFWDTNNGSLEVVLTNVDTYTYQAYPASVDVTFTNLADAGDTVTVTLEGVSADNTTVTTDALTKGASYRVTAIANSDSAYVTNTVSDEVTVADQVLLGDVNILSANYTYSDGWATFPRLAENFPLSGGAAGQVLGKQGSMAADVISTPVAANAGSAYSYTIKVDFGAFAMDGTLELRSDGTAEMSENGGGPIAAGTVTGSWVDNGDGTATISYSPADIKS